VVGVWGSIACGVQSSIACGVQGSNAFGVQGSSFMSYGILASLKIMGL